MSNVSTAIIAIADNDGGHVRIMHFVTEERDGETDRVRWRREASAENIEAEITKSGLALDSVTWAIIDPADVPAQRRFRNSWRRAGGKIVVDLPLARGEQMVRIRRRRDALLRDKDGEWLREFSRGNQVAADAIEVERQALRQIPQEVQTVIEAAKTPDELDAVWPAGLGPR